MSRLLQQTAHFFFLSCKSRTNLITQTNVLITVHTPIKQEKVICINLLSRIFPVKSCTFASIPLKRDVKATVLAVKPPAHGKAAASTFFIIPNSTHIVKQAPCLSAPAFFVVAISKRLCYNTF